MYHFFGIAISDRIREWRLAELKFVEKVRGRDHSCEWRSRKDLPGQASVNVVIKVCAAIRDHDKSVAQINSLQHRREHGSTGSDTYENKGVDLLRSKNHISHKGKVLHRYRTRE